MKKSFDFQRDMFVCLLYCSTVQSITKPDFSWFKDRILPMSSSFL